MKKRLVLRPYVLPTLYIIMIIGLIMFTSKILYKDTTPQENDLEYVSDTIFENVLPVLNEEVFVLNPYSGSDVIVKVGFYDYLSDNEVQENSIINYENTYLQNTGLSYYSDKEFKVIAVMNGEVTKVYDNDLLGSVVEITHDNGLITIYQMINNIKVNKGDIVQAGEEIATSGVCKLFSEGNNLHFEVLKDGDIKNPNLVLGKNIKDI